MKENYFKKVDIKRKFFSKGGNAKRFKRFKKTPKFIRDNPENQVAREKEKDEYNFVDSEDDGEDLGMGLEISDLPILDDNYEERQKGLIALTQDTVRPLYANEQDYDEQKVEDALAELKFTSFRSLQKETVKRILFGRSTLFISPTGSGKSLCYQLPALLYWRARKYITIVVSPLISLMEDQMKNMPKSLKAVSLNSTLSLVQRRRSIQQLANNDAQVAFISPEAIVGGLLSLDDLKDLPPVGFICIDEAHCLSEWSHNFRPAYLQFFKILSEEMKIKTFLGLTATATKATSFAISRCLVINPETDVLGATTIPDNLILSVSHETNKELALINLLKTRTFRIMTSIIVYCQRRDDTETVAMRIRTAMQNHTTLIEVPERKKPIKSNNDSTISTDSDTSEKQHMKLTWHAEAYHAGLSTECRNRIQRRFIKGEIRVVVATVAFGMGINKSNIGAVIHYDMPTSFESYVQEIGRAGRDGRPAQCHMFLKADKTDVFYQQRNIYSSIIDKANLRKFISYVFKSCNCDFGKTPEVEEKLNNLNSRDPHTLKSEHKTNFINTSIEQPDSDDDDIVDSSQCENETIESKTRHSLKYMRKSVVRKHRRCDGHEKSFSVDEATYELNLRIESIITLICQLQKAYPQLKISQHPPVKSTCNLVCSHGPSQMENLARNNPIVKYALFKHKIKHKKEYGCIAPTPNRISFDVIDTAASVGKPSADAIRMLKKSEWELVEKTGRFRRSQIRVNFEGNAFHLTSIGDLNKHEIDEIIEFLYDFVRLYEKTERMKVAKLFHTLRTYSISMNQMENKEVRMQASSRLHKALNAYFSRSNEASVYEDPEIKKSESDKEYNVMTKSVEDKVRSDVSLFLSSHKSEIAPCDVARIFQGISTPKYPAEIWGQNYKWWRCHTNIDFKQLVAIAENQIILLSARSHKSGVKQQEAIDGST